MIFTKEILGKKVNFFLAILTFFKIALDAQQSFMLTIFFSFYISSVRPKVIAFFCENISKVEHTICDCN